MSKFAFGKTKLALVALAALAAMSSAQAVTETADLGVSLTLDSGCQFSAPSDAVAFARTTSTSAAVTLDATGTLNVTCTSGTNYTIGLNGGANNTGSVDTPALGSRRMQGTAGNYVTYDLYQEPTHTTFWGNVVNSDTFSSVGTGNPEAIPVYGRVTNVNAVAGVYADTVTATITY
ncbi:MULTISPECIES: spore coat U domain-containing protein [unclassified Polaromonas]|uniref:Csu type fimbrial protein n=1 Tax=unclassified Polaromonas TaxID=2638319 RepID=UPI000F08A22F|nr:MULTISPECIES: spore coat U domain-containing protein [unclassified Polaromonas]AYQ27321.1 SCPU domain-containing protein [Polaromonas sp. SP1]QGJ17837.1 spore coat protein [Polaromonas sp. Pch-P]